MPVELFYLRSAGTITPTDSSKIKTTWDDESIQKAIDFFSPVFEETDAREVYMRIGEHFETEAGEDPYLLSRYFRNNYYPTMEVLHLEIFLPVPSNRSLDTESATYEVIRKYDQRYIEWLREGVGKKDQFIRTRHHFTYGVGVHPTINPEQRVFSQVAN